MKLVFSEIKNGEIFEDDFQHLTEDNGTIEFKHMSGAGGIAVVYAPNGTGKSSFAKALTVTQTTEEISFSAQDEQGRTVTPESKPFHVIHDQISRNIIPGTETDYLIGRQIKHEYELRDRINLTFETAFQALANRYKTEFKVTKVGDYLLEQISRLTDETYLTGYRYSRSLVNKQTHGNDIDREEYIRFIRNAENRPALITLEDAKRQFIILDTSGRNSVTKRIIELDYTTIIQSNETVQIERHDDAIKILEKYGSLDSCVVCDNHNYDGEGLLSRKTENRKRIYDGLDRRTKELLDKVVKESALTNFDPFNIRQIVNSFISGGEATDLHRLQLELLQYVHVIGDEMVDALFQCFDETTLFSDYDEFVEITLNSRAEIRTTQ